MRYGSYMFFATNRNAFGRWHSYHFIWPKKHFNSYGTSHSASHNTEINHRTNIIAFATIINNNKIVVERFLLWYGSNLHMRNSHWAIGVTVYSLLLMFSFLSRLVQLLFNTKGEKYWRFVELLSSGRIEGRCDYDGIFCTRIS